MVTQNGVIGFFLVSETKFATYSYQQLRGDVIGTATALKSLGVSPGDRVVAYVSNCYETTVSALATAAIGAAWSSASVDFGTFGVLERFSQVSSN